MFAAASTTNAVDEIVGVFQQSHAVALKTNYASSSTLAQQIVNGAAAGVYLSANEKWADFLADRGMAPSRVELLTNSLVVVVPQASSLEIDRPEDLLTSRVEYLALGDPTHVPAGMYAKEALENLGLWEKLESKVVAGADVRQALSYVERGEAGAGIVYATDAAITDRVRVALAIASATNRPIRYSLVLTPTGSENPAAQSLFEFFRGAEAADIWQRHGFAVVAPLRENGGSSKQ